MIISVLSIAFMANLLEAKGGAEQEEEYLKNCKRSNQSTRMRTIINCEITKISAVTYSRHECTPIIYVTKIVAPQELKPTDSKNYYKDANSKSWRCFVATRYKKLADGQKCDFGAISSVDKCRKAAKQLGLKFAMTEVGSENPYEDRGGFPGCHHANDGRDTVYLNTNSNANGEKVNYAGICSIDHPSCIEIHMIRNLGTVRQYSQSLGYFKNKNIKYESVKWHGLNLNITANKIILVIQEDDAKYDCKLGDFNDVVQLLEKKEVYSTCDKITKTGKKSTEKIKVRIELAALGICEGS